MVVQGRQRRFISADLGGEPITEIWLGDKQIWPNMEGLARRITVEIPQQGTRDWQYWIHVLDSTRNGASVGNYLKFVADGMDFFINSSYDGTPVYRLSGNELIMDVADGVLIDQLGEYLEVKAKVPEREILGRNNDSGGVYSSSWDLPLLEGTRILADWWGGKRGKPRSLVGVAVNGTPDMNSYFYSVEWSWGKGRGDYWNQLVTQIGGWVSPADTGFKISFRLNGWAGIHQKRLRPVFPAFSRTFKLKIISVE